MSAPPPPVEWETVTATALGAAAVAFLVTAMVVIACSPFAAAVIGARLAARYPMATARVAVAAGCVVVAATRPWLTMAVLVLTVTPPVVVGARR